jgi:hypothetical protein
VPGAQRPYEASLFFKLEGEHMVEMQPLDWRLLMRRRPFISNETKGWSKLARAWSAGLGLRILLWMVSPIVFLGLCSAPTVSWEPFFEGRGSAVHWSAYDAVQTREGGQSKQP